MERVVVLQVTDYLNKNGLISKQQHGFLSWRSTTTNLLESLNDWSIALKDSHSVTVAYIDYTKAFDTVCHSKLFQKLSALGICGNLLAWIRCFLDGRTQRTRVGAFYYDTVKLNSGIIQGTCLGPPLFIIYINDVSSIFGNNTTCKMYADDLKLYSVVKIDADSLDRKAWMIL
jgi:ribonuclease P/MRP protein subunit RPP40